NTFDVCFAVNAAAVAATTLNDYFAQARRDPKIATYGIPALGSLPQFYGYVMGKTAGVALNAVPYRGAAPMVTDLVAGHLPAAVGPCREMMEQRKSGKLRFLATVQRLTWAPEVALFADSGVKLGPPSWVAVYAHAKVPADKLLAMQNAIRDLMQAQSFPDRMTAAGFVPRYVPGKELGALAQEATTYWGAQIRESGFRPE
ncbi:MAG TPA: tripartite tricarboxylate transporter substrate-binding protein, partial [Ramlibacter sp.]|nr:tripartite tricarboxylate transporter substrate-binding protein [Ramlibacter sp.]